MSVGWNQNNLESKISDSEYPNFDLFDANVFQYFTFQPPVDQYGWKLELKQPRR